MYTTCPPMSLSFLCTAAAEEAENDRRHPLTPSLPTSPARYFPNDYEASPALQDLQSSFRDTRMSINYSVHVCENDDIRQALQRVQEYQQEQSGSSVCQQSYERLPSITRQLPPPSALASKRQEDLHGIVQVPKKIRNPTTSGPRLRMQKEQRQILENFFLLKELPSSDEKKELARILQLTPTQVHNWFQNKRARSGLTRPRKKKVQPRPEENKAISSLG